MIEDSVKSNTLAAEALGTFFLVLTACGAIIVNDHTGGGLIGHRGISVVFGLIVMIMIYSIGNISGAHMNPAVTIGFLFAKRIGFRQTLFYIVFQIIGALAASLLLRLLFPDSTGLGETSTALPVFQAFLIEVVLTFLLMFVILNVSTGHMEKGIMAGVAIGATVCIAAMVGGPLTGASMNPARSLGPGIVSGNLEHIWLYIIAPVVGAVLASPLCRILQGPECCYVDCDVNKSVDDR